MRLVLRVGVLAFGVALVIAACGGPEGPLENTASSASTCSPPPSPSCGPDSELVQDPPPSPSPSPSSSPRYGSSGGGLRADGFVDDVCNFIKWVCKRKKANTPGGQCANGAPAACPADCWVPNGELLCTSYSCAGIADGSPPTESTGFQNGTGCQIN
jgi:hypothetical protein